MKSHLGSFIDDEIDDRRLRPDRRESARRKILKGGRTFWPNGDSSECIVYNLSDTGAQLGLRGPAPNIFDLVIEGDPRRYSCSVVWRNANRVGVKFKNQTRTVPLKPVSAAAQCRRYADECRKLAERVAPADRELLLEMAFSWISVTRRLRRNFY